MFVSSLIVTLLQVTPVTATPTPPAHPARDPNRRVCRDVGLATGSIVSRPRECRTAAEWREIDAQHGQDVDRFRNNNDSHGGNALGTAGSLGR